MCACAHVPVHVRHANAERTAPLTLTGLVQAAPPSPQRARPFGSITKLVPSLRELPICWRTASGGPGLPVRGHRQSRHPLAFKLNETSGTSAVEFYYKQHRLGFSWTISCSPFKAQYLSVCMTSSLAVDAPRKVIMISPFPIPTPLIFA